MAPMGGVDMAGSKWDAFDVLEGVLAHVKANTLPASVPVVHNAFYALSRKKNFKPFVQGYLFQKRTGFFFSERLQMYLENMELAGLVSSVNPDFDTYEIRAKLRNTFNEQVKANFSKQELKILSQMAQEFYDKVCSEPPAASAA
jgi:hypothetical protein